MITDKKKMSEILKNLGFEELNEMQQEMVLQCKKDNDIVLLSPTGSGKTAAFLIPILNEIDLTIQTAQIIIIAPSRELAIQINKVFKAMQTGLKSVCCYGGHDIKKEIAELKTNPYVVIGTPGRLLDHFRNNNINPDLFKVLILDEFDKSLEMGFTEEISSIVAQLKNVRKKVLTSATEGEEIPQYVRLNKPVTLSYLKESNIGSGLTLYQVASPVKDKLETLYKLICLTGEGQKIVFCNFRESIARVSDYLTSKGITNCVFHGAIEQNYREKAIAKFTNGSCDVLIATDLAARGLDIPQIGHIIHYHLPLNEDTFIHRNGRTARQNATGNSYIIIGPDEYLPDYISPEPFHYTISDDIPTPVMPRWESLYIGKGKRDKISKKDVVGFLLKTGNLEMSDIGIIDLQDQQVFAAVKRTKIKELVKRLENKKIKNIKTIFVIAK